MTARELRKAINDARQEFVLGRVNYRGWAIYRRGECIQGPFCYDEARVAYIETVAKNVLHRLGIEHPAARVAAVLDSGELYLDRVVRAAARMPAPVDG